MSLTPALSALNAATETYPLLTGAQIARIRPLAEQKSVEVGQVLYSPGDVGVSLYILLSACIEVVQPEGDGEKLIGVLQPRMFTGEAGMIGGQRCVELGRVTRPGEVLRVSPNQLRDLVARDAQLGEILLRAFMLRRLMLIARQLCNVITPQLFESSLPGVFAVGDVRAGSMKRVASAVGEGAISVSFVHRALAEP
jgi:thioredoxin reductase (NADPH)